MYFLEQNLLTRSAFKNQKQGYMRKVLTDNIVCIFWVYVEQFTL